VLDEYFGGYITVAAFTAFGFILVGLAIWASGLIRPDKPNRIKSETYECGIDPVGGGWSQTHIRYYIFALLFLIFDVEAVFIFPWAINLELFSSPEMGMGAFILVEMVIFIVILLLGLVYALRKGVLRWE
jgi:NADH-quinone oxidoreductase subunit A